jgi:hypothetical protein
MTAILLLCGVVFLLSIRFQPRAREKFNHAFEKRGKQEKKKRKTITTYELWRIRVIIAVFAMISLLMVAGGKHLRKSIIISSFFRAIQYH